MSCSRARYLRLPTAVPRQAITYSRGIPPTSPTTPVTFFPKSTGGVIDDDIGGPSQLRLRTGAPSIPTDAVGLTRTRSRPEISPSRSNARAGEPRTPFGNYHTRNSSPNRSVGRPPSSTGVVEGGRSRLWLELREVQRKSRPSSQRSGEQ